MIPKILKKIGMAILYYFIATLFSTTFDMFGIIISRGVIFATIQALAISIILCACSRYLRIAKLKKEHKGDESEEKRIFNSDLMTKIKFILKTSDFKIETILFVLASLVIFINPALGGTMVIATASMISSAIYVIVLIIAVILSTVFMALLDIATWIMAYNRCYKRREY